MRKNLLIISIILILTLGIIGCTKIEAPAISDGDTVGQKETITIKPEEAYDIYLSKYPDFKVTSLKLELEMKKHIYEVEGFMDNRESEVKINAETGDIIKDQSEKDLDFDKVEILRKDVVKISELLKDATIDKDSKIKEWSLDYDDNILELEVEVTVGQKTIERTYNVESGQVIEIDN